MKTIKILLGIFAMIVVAVVMGSLGVDPLTGMGVVMAAPAVVGAIKTAKQLTEERAKVYEKLQEIVNAAKEEKRAFTEEEDAERRELLDKLDGLDGQIKDAERMERRMAEAAGGMMNKQNEQKEKEEVRSYSFAKAIRETMAGKLTGLELEMHQEAEREARNSGVMIAGVGIPSIVLGTNEQRDWVSGTAGTGGTLVPTELKSDMFIDSLVAKMHTKQLGATILTGLIGNVDIPRTAGVNAAWEGEVDAGAEVTPVTSKISLSPTRLGAYSQLSKLLLHQTSGAAERLVKLELEKAIRVALETAAINGSGTNEPTGVLNTSSIGSVAGGTNGLAPTLAHIINLEREVAVDNADDGALAYYTNPKVRAKLKATELDSGSGRFIWDKDNTLNGYKCAVSSLVPSDLDKGSSTGVCSAIIFGNWNDLIIGQWAGLDVLVDPYTDGKNSLVNVIVNSWWDIGVKHPESFAAMADALTT